MHNHYMQVALEQAWFGRGRCAPNPSVGALLVKDGKIIAKDWHRGPGTAHAEQRVLATVGEAARGAKLYITLEPCTHWGRTPPCVDAIIESGVSTVIYGFKDPNPIVARGDSTGILQARGIEVIHYHSDAIDKFYQSYLYWTQTKKPWITAKIAHSFDGKITDDQGHKIQISNEECAKFTHLQRLHSDVILTTAKTVINDDPLFTARGSETTKKHLALLDRNLTAPPAAKIFSSTAFCHIFHAIHEREVDSNKHCRYHSSPVSGGHLDLDFIFSTLGELGYHDVWVEAGGKLFSILHTKKLVHRSFIYLAPKILGVEATSAYQAQDFFNSNEYNITWQASGDNMIACFEWRGLI